MTNDTDILTWGQQAIDTLNHWPNWLLLACGCLIVGYVLRNLKRFPNEAIPGFIVMFAALGNAVLAGGSPVDQGFFVWTARNMLIGAIIGWVVWRVHYKLIKPLEEKFPWLRFLVPAPDETRFFVARQETVIVPVKEAVEERPLPPNHRP